MFRMVQKMCSPSFQDVPGLQLLTASPHEAPEARLQMTLVERKSVARRIKVFLGQVRLNGVLMSFDDVNDFRNSWTVQKKGWVSFEIETGRFLGVPPLMKQWICTL